MRVATSDMEAHAHVYHNVNCTRTGILVRIAWARSCMKVAVPNVIGIARGVTHHAHARRFNRIKQHVHRLTINLLKKTLHTRNGSHATRPHLNEVQVDVRTPT